MLAVAERTMHAFCFGCSPGLNAFCLPARIYAFAFIFTFTFESLFILNIVAMPPTPNPTPATATPVLSRRSLSAGVLANFSFIFFF